MVIIPNSYYKKEKNVKLTQYEIETIIEELERVEHKIFVFSRYDRIINKLKKGNKRGQ